MITSAFMCVCIRLPDSQYELRLRTVRKLQVHGDIRWNSLNSLIGYVVKLHSHGAQPTKLNGKRHLDLEGAISPPPKHEIHYAAQFLYGPL